MGGHRISPRRPFCPEQPVAPRASSTRRGEEAGLKKAEEVMESLEAFDLTGSLRGAAELAGCDHKTVAHWVAARDAAGGELPAPSRPRPMVDRFAAKIEELVERSRGKIRADKAHETLVAMGYMGSERTTRRAVAEAKRRWRQGHGRCYRPWITEPGLWMQWDYGDGPEVGGRATVLFCAWLAWSRFRVVLPLWDKTMPSVVMALDRTLRRFGSSPTYALTDNERTVSVDQVCGIAVRNPQIVSVGRHYGVTVATCVPADPESKGGSEATVRIAKADLVSTDHNLRPAYCDFAELEVACEAFCERVNTREHRVTRRPPAVMLVEERERMHPLPAVPHTVCFGQTRKVDQQSTIDLYLSLFPKSGRVIRSQFRGSSWCYGLMVVGDRCAVWGSFVGAAGQGHRCAASCAGPCRAGLDSPCRLR